MIAGALGAPDRRLTASILSLQLDHIDDFILEEQPLSGTLSAQAQVTGSFDRPAVEAEIEIIKGAYRGFEYEKLAGTIAYDPALVKLDVHCSRAPGRH